MIYDLRNLSGYKHLCALVLVLLGALCPFQVSAATVADNAFDRFMWTVTGANSQSVTVGTGGTPVASPTGSGTISADGSKTLQYGRDAAWRNASGNTVAGKIGARIPITAAAARLLGNGLKVLPLIGTGYALWTMAHDLGFDRQSDGSWSSSNAFVDTSANAHCKARRFQSAVAVGVCQAEAWLALNPSYSWSYSCAIDTTDHVLCTGPLVNSQGVTSDGVVGASYTVADGTSAVSIEQIEDAIASESGWPSSSSIAKALVESAELTGQKIPVESPSVTGPATSPGTTKTEVDSTANTTKSTAVTHHHTYNDNRVTNTTSTVVNVTNNSTGKTQTTTTTEEPVEDVSDCEKNPLLLNCSDLDTPDDEIPTSEKTITFAAENLGFAGGSCPADVNKVIAGKTVKLVDWTSNCGYVTTYAKPMILAMATFAALMIIFVGGKPE